jgi:starch-binding outer membrane protein, SusD/RagB family
MKKFRILILALVAAAAFSSCQDNLDLRSNGTIDMSQVFSDRNRTKGYLNACYSYVKNPYIHVGSYTDDAQNSQAITAGSYFDLWYNAGVTSSNFDDNNWDSDSWNHYFQGVRKCNVFLANIDNATAEMTDDERAGWKAQALTLRAYYYLQLMKRYGKLPLITKDLGTTHDYSTDTKASVSEIAAQILSDCDAAIATKDSDAYSYVYSTQQWGMATKALAQAVRCDVAAYVISPLMGDGGYTASQALDIAADALANILANDYSLWTTASAGYNAYASYFLYDPDDYRARDKETILGGSRASVWADCGLPIVSGSTSAGTCPTQELVDAYEMANGKPAITGYSDEQHLQPIINAESGYDETKPYENRDPRFYATVFYNGSKRGNDEISTIAGSNCALNSTSIRYTHTGYYMRKYAHDASNRNSNSDGYVRIVRLAELYYNFAEVAYQAVGPDQVVTTSGLNMSARDAVNKVRARVGMPEIPNGLSASEFETRYRNDRRVEFALEYDRYFCLRRWKTLDASGVVSGMKISGTGKNLTYERFAFDKRVSCTDKYLLYPLKLTEATKILNLTGNDWQNPGW